VCCNVSNTEHTLETSAIKGLAHGGPHPETARQLRCARSNTRPWTSGGRGLGVTVNREDEDQPPVVIHARHVSKMTDRLADRLVAVPTIVAPTVRFPVSQPAGRPLGPRHLATEESTNA
jgi:hypothetical protein